MSARSRPKRNVDRQLELLKVEGWRKRRTEVAFDRSVSAARKAGLVEHLDDGAVTLGRALSRAVDMAEAARDVWALAAAARELRAVIERLRLDPVSRGVTQVDELAQLLAQMGNTDG